MGISTDHERPCHACEIDNRQKRKMLLPSSWGRVLPLLALFFFRNSRWTPEFNNAGCLLISEVKYLLENRDKDPPDTA